MLSGRNKTTIAVVAGISTGVGLALLTSQTTSRFFLRYLSASTKPYWNMTVKIASNESQCISLINELKSDIRVSKVLGFDCEWTQDGSKRNRVALLQLATHEGQCGLFQIHLYSSVPNILQEILADKTILKVGVDPLQDAKHLKTDYGVDVAGTLDIRHLVEGKDLVGGLAAVVKSELGVTLPKDFHVRVSNWEANTLTSSQKTYAANDALGALHAFKNLIYKKVKVPFFSSKEDQWQKVYDHCIPLLDVSFVEKRKLSQTPASEGVTSPVQRPKSGQPNSTMTKRPGKQNYRAFCPRRTPFYNNAFMLAPDGEVLCTCDHKKANWYVSKGLATIVEREPLKIQLTFEPSGRVNGPSAEYYALEKKNQCVACGETNSYVRKKIVPHEYRRHFPDCMKNHQSHDVLLLCAPCHARSNIADLNLRLKLAQICNAPFHVDENLKVMENSRNKSLRSAARALLNNSNKLPIERQKELTDLIQESCKSCVTPELLNELKNMDIMVVNEDYTPHGLLVVEHFARSGIQGLMNLEKIWREHFISVMEPMFLPDLWSVDHYHEKSHEFYFDTQFLDRINNIPSAKRK